MVIDNLDLFEMHDREQAKRMARLPKCKCCGYEVQQEEAVCIEGDYYCDDEDCEFEAWKRIRKDYVEEVA